MAQLTGQTDEQLAAGAVLGGAASVTGHIATVSGILGHAALPTAFAKAFTVATTVNTLLGLGLCAAGATYLFIKSRKK